MAAASSYCLVSINFAVTIPDATKPYPKLSASNDFAMQLASLLRGTSYIQSVLLQMSGCLAQEQPRVKICNFETWRSSAGVVCGVQPMAPAMMLQKAGSPFWRILLKVGADSTAIMFKPGLRIPNSRQHGGMNPNSSTC